MSGPHAATRVDGSDYRYDANGNNVSGGGRSTTYSTFDKPVRIEKDGHITEFAYGPDRNRYRRVDTESSGVVRTTHYVGNVEFTENSSSNTTEIKRYIGDVAIVTLKVNSVQGLFGEEIHYRHYDHLGSLDLVTDGDGNIVDQLSFDPWGKRRQVNDWAALSPTALTAFTSPSTLTTMNVAGLRQRLTRGFTGHEMLDEVGIIHMNGRIYDPHLARFVQADPIIQDPFNTQSLNRYSYLWNNPLNGTDPSGFEGESIEVIDLINAQHSADILGIELPTLEHLVIYAEELEVVREEAGFSSESTSDFSRIYQDGDPEGQERLIRKLKTEDVATIGNASTQLMGSGPLAGETFRFTKALAGSFTKAYQDSLRKTLLSRMTERLKEKVRPNRSAEDFAGMADNEASGFFSPFRRVVPTNDKDAAAQAFARKHDGQASVKIEGFGNREFDMVSERFVGQAFGPRTQGNAPAFQISPKNFLSKSRRAQIRATLEAAKTTQRQALFEFSGGHPHQDVMDFIVRNAKRLNADVNISSFD
ncbi:RHS repeat domain-containing protein [Porticoccus sp. GXU_MW_L64]